MGIGNRKSWVLIVDQLPPSARPATFQKEPRADHIKSARHWQGGVPRPTSEEKERDTTATFLELNVLIRLSLFPEWRATAAVTSPRHHVSAEFGSDPENKVTPNPTEPHLLITLACWPTSAYCLFCLWVLSSNGYSSVKQHTAVFTCPNPITSPII